jgi:hypothetical protein
MAGGVWIGANRATVPEWHESETMKSRTPRARLL